jgi:trimethylamine:corrinoid methyltransferase-like protein
VRPRLSVNGPFGVWQAAGARDTYALAREEVKRIGAAAPEPFDALRAARLDEIVAGFRG